MRRLWAVARETFIECLRTRTVAVFVLALAASLLAMGLTVKGDGTLKGRIQTFLAYGTQVTQLLLCAATVLLAVTVTTEDVRSRTIFTVVAKPLARWQYLLGRWAGIVLIDAAALAVSAAGIYGLAQHLRTLPTESEEKVRQGLTAPGGTDVDRLAVENEVFAARASHRPRPIVVKGEVQRQYDRLIEERGAEALVREQIKAELEAERGRAVEGPAAEREIAERAADPDRRKRVLDAVKDELRTRIAEARMIVPPGLQRLPLVFEDLEGPAWGGDVVQLRYTLHPLPRPGEAKPETVTSTWQFSGRNGAFASVMRTDAADTASSFLIASDFAVGTLTVNYLNYPYSRNPVKLKLDEVSLLYPVATFEASFARGMLLVLMRLMFLAALGVLLGVFLSFPVACLTAGVLLTIGVMGGFILEATEIHAYTDASGFDYFSHYLVRGLFHVFPRLPLVGSPAEALVAGTNTGWTRVGEEVVKGTGVRALAALLVGWLIFRRRELARVQV